MFGLPLLKTENFGNCFGVDFMNIKPMDERINTICDYVVDSCINVINYFFSVLIPVLTNYKLHRYTEQPAKVFWEFLWPN